MLMIQSTAAALGNGNIINGNSGSSIDGAIYFPRGKIDVQRQIGRGDQMRA